MMKSKGLVKKHISGTKTVILIIAVLSIFVSRTSAQFPGWESFDQSNSGIPFEKIYMVEVDQQGKLWFGTNVTNFVAHIGNYDGNSWMSDFSGEWVYDISVDKDGIVWTTTSSMKLKAWNGTSWTEYTSSHLTWYSNPVYADQDGNVWMNPTQSGNTGLSLLKFDGTNWTNMTTGNSSLPSAQIKCITGDANNLIIGTEDSGLVYYDGTNWTTYNKDNSGLTNNCIYKAVFDANDTLWLATDNGDIVAHKGNTWIVYHSNDIAGLSSTDIYDMDIDSKGNIWLVLTNSVFRFDKSSWTKYDNTNSTLPAHSFKCIAVDHSDKVWIGTRFGLTSYDQNANQNPPSISSHPANQIVEVGDNVEFKVIASGFDLNYQWKKNGSNISGENSSIYTINDVTFQDSGNYTCEVSNDNGTVTTNTAFLKVTDKIPFKISDAKWDWVQQNGGSGWEHGNAIATDKNGNVFATGIFVNEGQFDDSIITSFGSTDIYIVKYDINGNQLWVHTAGGTGAFDWGRDITTDSEDNVLVTGYFGQTATFSDTSLIADGSSDAFLAKYSNNGQLIWVRKLSDAGYGVTTDNDDNIFVCGYFYNTGTFGDTTMQSSGDKDIFLAKYDKDGNFLWARKGGGSSPDRGVRVATDSKNSVYLTGYFEGAAQIGSGMLTSSGSEDIFIAKYSSEGNMLWLKHISGSSKDQVRDIVHDKNNGLYVTGYFSNNANFVDLTASCVGLVDIFIAKFDNSGNNVWLRTAGGEGQDEGSSIDVNSSGVYISGFFAGAADFSDTSVTSVGPRSSYVVKYSTSGKLIWLQTAGGEDHDLCNGIACTPKGNVFVTGEHSGTGMFGDTSITPIGSFDSYIARLIEDFDTTISTFVPNISNPNNISAYPNPFNRNACIRYFLTESSNCKLSIYDFSGKLVATPVNELQQAGEYKINLDGGQLNDGVYIYDLTIGNNHFSNKLIKISQ